MNNQVKIEYFIHKVDIKLTSIATYLGSEEKKESNGKHRI